MSVLNSSPLFAPFVIVIAITYFASAHSLALDVTFRSRECRTIPVYQDNADLEKGSSMWFGLPTNTYSPYSSTCR
ncbi:hypothetical protein SISNIDRAFT_491985 [Sistotremastrum niveocremeum HHB9708]|uniref:Uncharacterized protein n=1 Tax=Sistotremastrum niveocremeum HHB9708 TaxID=1314777 RepID=A0A164M6C8_9AGAM|nr:hypothetical protein SISNIDRAFT_491985 [Sistotremastrum niveocremeum HHB9708]